MLEITERADKKSWLESCSWFCSFGVWSVSKQLTQTCAHIQLQCGWRAHADVQDGLVEWETRVHSVSKQFLVKLKQLILWVTPPSVISCAWYLSEGGGGINAVNVATGRRDEGMWDVRRGGSLETLDLKGIKAGGWWLVKWMWMWHFSPCGTIMLWYKVSANS